MTIGMAIGLTGTIAFLNAATPPPSVEIEWTVRYTYDGGRTEPGDEKTRLAENLASSAEAALIANDLYTADELLGHCIELADLRECHRMLAPILYLVRDDGAHAHFDQATLTKQKPRP